VPKIFIKKYEKAVSGIVFRNYKNLIPDVFVRNRYMSAQLVDSKGKKKTGRPSHKPTEQTRQTVRDLSAFGITHEHIARRLGITHETLVKHYKDDLEDGHINAVMNVANALYHQATVMQIPASTMFFLKTRGRWRETDDGNNKLVIEVKGALPLDDDNPD